MYLIRTLANLFQNKVNVRNVPKFILIFSLWIKNGKNLFNFE